MTVLENISENAESDVRLARDIIKEIAGDCWGGKGDMLFRVHRVVAQHYPRWTLRRIRSFWHGEAANVKWFEMNQLAAVAKAASTDREELEAARAEHAAYVAKTAAMALAVAGRSVRTRSDALAGQDIGSQGRAGLGGDVRGNDCAGTGAAR